MPSILGDFFKGDSKITTIIDAMIAVLDQIQDTTLFTALIENSE
ncbi:MAG: hypothetical protein S4CHLAM20_00720 [Chlamydiia bacterium]|nr:hypothetical protein [Chlamydiia bacterium]